MTDFITYERLREVLTYDPSTGVFTWSARGFGRRKTGFAGSVRRDGYLEIMIDNKRYNAHRLAWFMYTGAPPKGCIDHINRVKLDNRIVNLRDVSPELNNHNQKPTNRKSATGLLGAYPHGPGYQARIQAGGVRVALGTFPTAEEAHAAYLEAKRRLHEGNTL